MEERFQVLNNSNWVHSTVLQGLPSEMSHSSCQNSLSPMNIHVGNNHVSQQSCVVICSIENVWNHGFNLGRTVQIADLLPDSRTSLRNCILITHCRYDIFLNQEINGKCRWQKKTLNGKILQKMRIRGISLQLMSLFINDNHYRPYTAPRGIPTKWPSEWRTPL